MKKIRMIVAFALTIASTYAQSSGPAKGILILSGGDYERSAIEHFISAAGGSSAKIIFVPTAASAIRLPSGFIHYCASYSE